MYQHSPDCGTGNAAATGSRMRSSGGPQRSVSASATAAAATGTVLQKKLTVNQPGDRYEQEADRMAEKVMRMSDSQIQRACAACQEKEEKQIMRMETGGGGAEVPSQVYDVIGSGGSALDGGVRSFMESRFGHDFGDVRVHTDTRAAESAQAVNARAYTVGNDVVFAPGEYNTSSTSGRHLLAHELTHVLQQGGGGALRSSNALQRKIAGMPVTSLPGAMVQRAPECDIDHVVTECAGASSQCLVVQDSYCKKNYPTTKDIDSLHAQAILGATAQKGESPQAAENLLHFLKGSGSEKVMPVDIFKNHGVTKKKLLDEHRSKFIEGASKRLKDGRLKVGGSAEMTWTGTANAFNYTTEDLGIAVGGYTLCSKVKVSARSKGKGAVEIVFDSWSVQAFDCYNWDPGKGIGALFGGVNDKDLCCLQNAGKGKHFRIRTDAWNNDYAPCIAPATVSGVSTPDNPVSPDQAPDR